MKRFAWGAALLAVATSVVVLLIRARSTRADDGGAAEVVPVVRRDIGATVKATGVIKPRVGAEVRVGSRISGVVERLYVQIGDTVTKGQLLAQLDERDLVARRDEATAALQQAEVNVSFAKLDLDRKRALLTTGNISPSEVELAEQAFAVGQQRVIGARASLAFATTQLGYSRISAPISGVVASVSTQEGETVAASFAAPTFLTLIDPHRMEVWAYVDETDIGRIQPGQRAQFTVDTYGEHAFDGRVSTVYPKAEIRDNVVNYVTVVTFTPPRERVLRPEMTTTVRVELDVRKSVLTVPIRAIRYDTGRAFVLLPGVAAGGAAAERRWVTIGRRDDTHVEIAAGLRDGDRVLIGDLPSNGRPNE